MKSLDEFQQKACSNCGSLNLIWDQTSGEVICRDCGMVIVDSIIYMGPERRAFSLDEVETRNRVGLPLRFSIHDKGLPTLISQISKDAHGNTLPYETKVRMYRLQRWQVRSRISQNLGRNLAEAMSHIELVCDKLNIPQPIKEEAAIIYRKALKNGLVRGRTISSLADASLYAACRIAHTPRRLEDLSKYSIDEKQDIARDYRLILRELELKIPAPEATRRVPNIANKIGIGIKTQQRAAEILHEAKENYLTAGKNPTGLAAAALYIACSMNEEKVTQKMLSDASGITEVTIRNRYKDLIRGLHLKL